MAFTNAAEKWAFVGEKNCTRCYQTKPLEEFTVRQSGPRKGHPTSYCKKCKVIRQKQNYNNGTYQRVTRPYLLKSKYGITPEKYEKMFREQNGKCAICGDTDGKSARGTTTFCVDHCHKTGKIRGLLCNNCNRCLGLLKDDPSVLEKAIEYLK